MDADNQPDLIGAEISLLQILLDRGPMTFMQINAISHNTNYWIRRVQKKGYIELIHGRGYTVTEAGRKALESLNRSSSL